MTVKVPLVYRKFEMRELSVMKSLTFKYSWIKIQHGMIIILVQIKLNLEVYWFLEHCIFILTA